MTENLRHWAVWADCAGIHCFEAFVEMSFKGAGKVTTVPNPGALQFDVSADLGPANTN